MIIFPLPETRTIERKPTEAELLVQIGSLEYSIDEKDREHFRAGANWALKEFFEDDERVFSLKQILITSMLIIYVSWSVCGWGIGMVGSKYSDSCDLNGKWNYVSPTYKLGCEFKKWMDK